MGDTNLIETLESLKDYSDKGYDVYFEGRGDGYVKAIAEAVFFE